MCFAQVWVTLVAEIWTYFFNTDDHLCCYRQHWVPFCWLLQRLWGRGNPFARSRAWIWFHVLRDRLNGLKSMEPCRVKRERSIKSDGSTYLRSFYGSQSCDVWMPHKLKGHSCERWKHCCLCLTAGEPRYSKMKYLGQGHCGNLWQSKVCQTKPCQVSSWYVDDWASFPRSMGRMGCSCLLSPSAPSSLS